MRLGRSLALLLALFVAGCSAHRSSAPDTFVFARGADSQKLDPHDVDDGESIKVLVNICEGLVRFKPHTTEIEPCLATSWNISADGRTYTFQLRPQVRFHDGLPLDARNAAFSFHRQMDPAHPAHTAGATFSYWSAMFNMVAAVEAVDDRTLRFQLREPHAPFLASLAIPAAALISPRFIDQRTPVGTGPFRFVAWAPNERIVLERNPDYWDGGPSLQHLVFTVVPDNATRLIQLQTGQIDGLDGLDPNDLPVVAADKNLTLVSTPGLNVCYLAFNTQKPPLDRRETRRAIAAAIKKDELVRAVYGPGGTVAKNPLPPFVPGYNDDIPSSTAPRVRRGSPDRADSPDRQVSRPLRLFVMTNPRPYLPNPLRAAEMIKADCAAAGIPIEIVANEWGAHLTRVENGQHDLALLGWVGDNGDADNFLYVLLDKETAVPGSALNIAFWKNDGYHELMLQARREIDPVKRAAVYHRAQELIYEECPLLPLAHAKSQIAIRQAFDGVLLQPNGDVLFQHAKYRKPAR